DRGRGTTEGCTVVRNAKGDWSIDASSQVRREGQSTTLGVAQLSEVQPDLDNKRNNRLGAWNIAKGSSIEGKGNIPDSAGVLQVLRQFKPQIDFRAQNNFFIYPDIPQNKLANARNKCNVPADE